jgi:5-methyltetrahydrofolate--homocysteine methyltransferase
MNTILQGLLQQRILILDGATGSMIQTYRLTEDDFRGSRFRDWGSSLKGNNDLLCLTKPEVVTEIHQAYLKAGADLIETNSFNATAISLADYDMSHLAYEINFAAASLAKVAANAQTQITPEKPRFVVGSMGPTNKTASMSPDVTDPAARAVTFDELRDAYSEQVRGLREGGADILMVETIFDTLNAKAALFAIAEEAEKSGINLPVMISVTVADSSGRTLSGQTLRAFLASVGHVDVLSIGMNCGFGATQMRPYLEELASVTPYRISLHPNAGLPNQLGEYDESPETMSATIEEYLQKGWINIVGGCCGTRPPHIAAIAEVASKYKPRVQPDPDPQTWISGLEPLHIFPGSNFVNIGERCNVAGSRKFARLMKEENYEEALSIARQQVENGAQVIDVCMDDAMLDAKSSMIQFLNLIASEPEISKVPMMIDSSKWEVLEAGLKCTQGKPIVNSISLKEGDDAFLEKAKLVHRYGASVVVMLFDETGQADSFERKISVAERSYNLLVSNGFRAENIIFDPNVLAIATGIAEHNNYGVDFIRACEWIKANLPHAKISGGISNLSFSFRGNDLVREAIHSVFLYHAIKAGLDMGIVNAGQLMPYDQIDARLLQLTEDVVLNRRPDATEEMLVYAEELRALNQKNGTVDVSQKDAWRNESVEERLKYALVRGMSDYLTEDVNECLQKYPAAIDIIEGPLMSGMNTVGDLFGNGKMFLPQVVKSARVMKAAVAILEPAILAQKKTSDSKPTKFLLATVKGDVHDIGKNIVSVVLSCNGFEIIDLGVMVPGEKILEEARAHQVDAIGLSGLITPSLDEMSKVCQTLQEQGFNIPVLIGGATTSELHTSIRIAPEYKGGVFYVKDASRASAALKNATEPGLKDAFRKETDARYATVRKLYEQTRRKSDYLKLSEARSNALKLDWKNQPIDAPAQPGLHEFQDFPLEEIIPFIDWTYFFYTWDMRGTFPAVFDHPEKGVEARKLYDEATQLLKTLVSEKKLRAKAIVGLFPAQSQGDDIYLLKDNEEIPFYQLRDQRKRSEGERNLCLSDFIAPKDSGVQDYMGAFAASIFQEPADLSKQARESGDDYTALLIETLCDRLVEAFAELLHFKVRKEYWGYAADEAGHPEELRAEKFRGIRPAIGYPACPDHSEKERLFKLLEVQERIGSSLTDSFMMNPASSVSGFYLASPSAKYYNIIHITKDQADDYFKRKGRVFEPMRQFII